MNMQTSENRKMFKFCCLMAALHFCIILVSIPIANLNEGWNFIFVWGVWIVIDFPISILNIVLYNPLISLQAKFPALEYVLYPPYFIHGLLGTVWWFYLPRIYYKIKNRKIKS
jgi:hypothetical protein